MRSERHATDDTRDGHRNRRVLPTCSAPPSNSSLAQNNTTEQRKYDGLVEFESGLMCTLCNQQQFRRYISALRHITGETHREHLKKYLKISPSNNPSNFPDGIEEIPFENFLLCTICNRRVPPNRMNLHIATIDHLTNGKKVIHRVSMFEFKCQICNQKLIGYKRAMSHLRNENHRRRKARAERGETIKFSTSASQPRDEEDDLKIKEEECDDYDEDFIPLQSSTNVFESYSEPETFPADDKVENEESGFIDNSEFPQEEEEEEEEEKENQVMESESSELESMEPASSPEQLPAGITKLYNEKALVCLFCDCVFLPDDADGHVTGIKHQENLKKRITRVSHNKYSCDICYCHLNNPATVTQHLESNSHRSKKAFKDSRYKRFQDEDIAAAWRLNKRRRI